MKTIKLMDFILAPDSFYAPDKKPAARPQMS